MVNSTKDMKGQMVDADDDDKDVAFYGFATATPQQLLKLRFKHNGATTSPTPEQEKTDSEKEYERDLMIAIAAKHKLAADLVKISGCLFSSTKYDDLGSASFGQYVKNTTRQLYFKWNDVQQRADAAAIKAKEDPSADNFMAFEHVRLQRKIVATEIVMAQAALDGKPEEYNHAKAAHDEFVGYETKMQSVMERMAPLSESDKATLLSQAFPMAWSQYKQGELKLDRVSDPAAANSYKAVQEAASNDGIEQPFIQTLKDLFSAAGRFLLGDSSAPASQTQHTRAQPQPIVGG